MSIPEGTEVSLGCRGSHRLSPQTFAAERISLAVCFQSAPWFLPRMCSLVLFSLIFVFNFKGSPVHWSVRGGG